MIRSQSVSVPKTAKLKFAAKDKSLFSSVLKKRVDAYFEERGISKHANATMVIKTIVMLSGYIVPFVCLLAFLPPVWVALLLWTLMGIALAGIGMSVMHDANHGSYSEHKIVNTLVGHTLNLVGGLVHNWKLQHNVLHHTYTNISGHDDDIADRLVLKFSPHTQVKWYHRFQPFYACLFYGIMTFYWVFFKDFVQYVQYNRRGVNPNTPSQNAWLLTRLILLKSTYVVVMLILPTLTFGIPFWQILLGFSIMHFTAGTILSLIFQLAHTVEETHHPLPNEAGVVENDWAIHQMNTTVNFSRSNKFLSWYVGGLNFQVEHHLFPKICHVHYPAIAPIVKQTAEEYGIPYLEQTHFSGALKSHFTALKRFGTLPHPDAIFA
jgi:linoleoyl-CoA desaturase